MYLLSSIWEKSKNVHTHCKTSDFPHKFDLCQHLIKAYISYRVHYTNQNN
ncbi:hypothetical protein YC2023_117275 [Brassica napus]